MKISNSKNKKIRDFKTAEERRKFIEEELKIKLPNIGMFSLDEKVAGIRNCENMIGVAQVPIGLAGPLKIKNQKSKVKSYFIPLATTEGVLVASVNRGCKVISESEGATVAVENVGVTRGPVFETPGIRESLQLKKWLDENFNLFSAVAQKESSHLRLKKLETRMVGRNVFVRFYFDACDAMGMNMATIVTASIIYIIEVKTGMKCISVAGNFDIDKKAAYLNSISGRGKQVWAEATIKRSIIKEVLKTTAKKIFDVWLAKCMIGSAMSGSLGFNAQFANVIAAIFIATGQDSAHVVEGSMGITTTEVLDSQDLYISVYLPSLMVGTVGGGTGLATQQEALRILGVAGGNNGNNALQFAGLAGGAVLAGELSLLASLAEGSLAKAHETLARGKLE